MCYQSWWEVNTVLFSYGISNISDYQLYQEQGKLEDLLKSPFGYDLPLVLLQIVKPSQQKPGLACK